MVGLLTILFILLQMPIVYCYSKWLRHYSVIATFVNETFEITLANWACNSSTTCQKKIKK